jgi:hypothetical protein
LKEATSKYIQTKREGILVYAHHTDHKIYIPALLRAVVIEWFQTMLQHPGVKPMQATVKENLYWPGIDALIKKYVKTFAVCLKKKSLQ